MRRLVAAVVLVLADVAGRLVDVAISVAERELERAEVGYYDREDDE